ncbi:hypothetical protein [Halorussus sp. AFM4]|uniref:hypothetical protein n=1 Tax=Halorussus sp. AFM4 TaxID=3421651 RepID=UPI003EBE1066
MEFSDLSDRVRYGIALAAIVAVAAVVGEAIVVLRFADMLLFVAPLLVIVLGGIVWDRIHLHGKTV